MEKKEIFNYQSTTFVPLENDDRIVYYNSNNIGVVNTFGYHSIMGNGVLHNSLNIKVTFRVKQLK